MPQPLVALSSSSSLSPSSSSPPPYSAPPSDPIIPESPRSDSPPASEWTVPCPNCARPVNCCGACPGDYVLDNGAHCCSSNCRWTVVLLGGDHRRRRHHHHHHPRHHLFPNRPPNYIKNKPRRQRQRIPIDTSDIVDELPQANPGLLVDEPFFDIIEP